MVVKARLDTRNMYNIYERWILALVIGLGCIKLAHGRADPKSGPFESVMVRTSRCEKQTKPVDLNPPVIFQAEMYNTSSKINLLRGNITILKDCKNKKIKAKAFYWEQGKWKLIYLISNMGCSCVFMPVITFATGVKYDEENCIFFKGQYSFDNVDTNHTQHLLRSRQEYGRIMWRNEFFSQAGSVFCWEFETLVVPLGQLKF